MQTKERILLATRNEKIEEEKKRERRRRTHQAGQRALRCTSRNRR